jgi:hypothetical protein
MKKYKNSAKATVIYLVLFAITCIWLTVVPLDVDYKIWLRISLIALYVAGGVVFLDAKQKAFLSLCPFLIGLVIIFNLLSVAARISMLLFAVNQVGLILVYLLPLPNSFELPLSIISNTIAAIIPPLLMYFGLKLSVIFNKFHPAKDKVAE